jgi:hypothetical protein
VEVLRPPDPRLARRGGGGDVPAPDVGRRRTDGTAAPGQRVLRRALLHARRRLHRRRERRARRNLQQLQGLARQQVRRRTAM